MQYEFNVNKLQDLISNVDVEPMPFITVSALLEIKELETFIASAKQQQADSVRIYFIRFKSDDIPTAKRYVGSKEAEGCKWENTPNGFTQGSIAMVAAKNFRHNDEFIFAADDIVTNGQVTVLMPGVDTKGTAMNPPGTSGVKVTAS